MRVEAHPHQPSTQSFTRLYPSIYNVLQISLQSATKVVKHGRSTRENDVLETCNRRDDAKELDCAALRGEKARYAVQTHVVQASSNIDRTGLNDIVDDFR